eukprot:CAMPEP_0117068214 /NCGR_PEP_ID=MMETSP0472-20121206/47799_1 /TAXON_ID=693140 ORGANISM="Tiarina fusus, Strain LIS" /NCGR_SAMPLE_ID=MMETSP0472 /ASSEMBLY_ACC=CAM_ASM_000603 /LENGTH=30 /DNA_ID= /DNA_START= /DNA_END= /DNA_ORIENTATION=
MPVSNDIPKEMQISESKSKASFVGGSAEEE